MTTPPPFAPPVPPDEQFERDLRGDHDGPRSYMLPRPPDTTPSVAEVLSAWED